MAGVKFAESFNTVPNLYGGSDVRKTTGRAHGPALSAANQVMVVYWGPDPGSAEEAGGETGFLRGRPRCPGATRRLAVCARLAMKVGPPSAH